MSEKNSANASSQSTSSDCETLNKAMVGLGTDEEAIIGVLSNRSYAQRVDIVKAYTSKYSQALDTHLRSELSGPHLETALKLTKVETQPMPMMALGRVTSFVNLPTNIQKDVESAVTKYRTTETLLSIADSLNAFPNSSVLKILMDSIELAGDNVSQTFFGKQSTNAIWGGQNFTEDRDDLAVALLSASVNQVARFDFNKTTDGVASDKLWQGIVRGNKGGAMGMHLLLQVLTNEHDFQAYLDNKSHWVPLLEDILSDQVYILGTIVKQLTSQTGLPAMLKLLFLKFLGSTKFDAIVSTWKELSSPSIVQPAVQFATTDNYLIFAVGKLSTDPFIGAATAACSKSNTRTWNTTIPSMPMPGGMPSMPITTVHTETVYGGSVRTWIDSKDGPRRLNLRTPTQPNNVQRRSSTKNPMGCFIAGTNVLMKNRKVITIEHLQENDKIIGMNGNVGIISSEEVVNVLESDAAIYGFNDDEPFFTASHPFWTQHGWRALNPHDAHEENPSWLEVGQLTEGDYVRRIKSYSDVKIEYEWVVIDRFHWRNYPAGAKIYGVHTREGPRSYHANGYVVMQNYPEITISRLKDGMKHITHDEHLRLHDGLKDLEPILHKVLGPGATSAVTKLAGNYVADNVLKSPEKRKVKKVHLREVSLPHVNLEHHAGTMQFESYVMPSKLSMARGHLFLDGEHVADTHITEDDQVSWTRPVADGKWEHGSVKFYPGRQHGHAFVSLTRAREDTKSIVSASLLAAAHTSTYKCYKSVDSIKEDTDTGSKYDPFGELIMGIDFSKDQGRRIGKVMIPPEMDEPDDLGNHVVYTVDEKFQLHVNVIVPADYQDLLGYTRLSGVFSWDYHSFSGFCVSYDGTKPDLEGDHFAWKGEIEETAEHDALHRVARTEGLKSGVHSHPDSSHSIPFSKTMNLTNLAPASAAPMRSVMASLSDQQLSIEVLFTITPPDPQSIHDLTFSLLQKGMKYAMDDDDRENILGVNKPTDLGGEMLSTVDKYKTFLGTNFANSYVMYSLSQNAAFKDKITQEQRDKMLYYWNANEDGCLSHDKDYSGANKEIGRIAYIQACPEIQKFLDSKEGGPAWAKKLYTRLLDPVVLTGFALSVDINQTMAIIQKQSMVLYCLDPDQNYGSELYKKIMVMRLNLTSGSFKGDKGDEENMKWYVKDYIRQLIVSILAGSEASKEGPDKSLRQDLNDELTKQLQDAFAAFNTKIDKDNQAAAKSMMSHMDNFIDFTMAFFNASSKQMMTKVVESCSEWMERNPKLAMAGKFFGSALSFSTWSMSLIYTIESFKSWRTLELDQKMQLVSETVSFTFLSVSKIPEVMEVLSNAFTKAKTGFKFMKEWTKVTQDEAALEGIEMEVMGVAEGEVATAEEAFANSNVAVAQEMAEAGSGNWGKFFAMTGQIARFTAAVALAFAAVSMGFQCARDFADPNAPVAIKVLDVLQEITLCIGTIAAFAGLLSPASVVVPVIGIIVAICGLVFTIASLFVHREPPKPKPTKTELFVTGKGSTYLETLKSPSKEWLDNFNKK